MELLFVHIVLAFSAIFPGLLLRYFRPGKPNFWIGYRTPWSKKSQATWDFAHEYSSRIMLWATLVIITVQVFTYVLLSPFTSILVTSAALTAGYLLVIALTEIRLRAIFDKDGNPKTREEY